MSTITSMERSPGKKRVLIVGAGAAGTAAAYALGKTPEKFEVHVWEATSNPGGVATSECVEGTLFINDGVQGGSPAYRNTLSLMSEFGFSGSPVHMMISFGKGSTAWTNYTKTDLTDKLRHEIKKFGTTLYIVNTLEFLFIFIPICKVLKMFGHSDDFANHMVFPLTALFFGTGNQTPSVSAAIIARVFLDDKLRLFDYDPERLLSQTPEMFAFPNLEKMYQTIISKTGCAFYPNRSVVTVVRKDGKVFAVDDNHTEEVFDEIIFTCNAETALKTLKNPTFLERQILASVRYYNDVTVTHEDDAYMEKHYELHKDVDQYFIRSDPADPTKLEMSFNLSNYQPQLKTSGRNIYQTIFLNDEDKPIWTIAEINKQKILLTKWWRQFSHTWRHFAFTVPLMPNLQGKQHTWFAGTYTLLGTHEVAIISGFAAAHRLGARYPFPHDALAKSQFEQYLLIAHGKPLVPGLNKGSVLSIILIPVMFVYLLFVLLLRFLTRW